MADRWPRQVDEDESGLVASEEWSAALLAESLAASSVGWQTRRRLHHHRPHRRRLAGGKERFAWEATCVPRPKRST